MGKGSRRKSNSQWHIPIGCIVVPCSGLYSGSYIVTPKKELLWSLWVEHTKVQEFWGLGVWGFRVLGLWGLGVWGLGFRGLGFWGLGIWGFRVLGLRA